MGVYEAKDYGVYPELNVLFLLKFLLFSDPNGPRPVFACGPSDDAASLPDKRPPIHQPERRLCCRTAGKSSKDKRSVEETHRFFRLEDKFVPVD